MSICNLHRIRYAVLLLLLGVAMAGVQAQTVVADPTAPPAGFSASAMESMEVTGQAGGGMVTVTLSGRHEARRVRIDPMLLKDDPEMVEDLLAAAINDAVNKVAELSASRMAKVTGGMNLPPGFKLPF